MNDNSGGTITAKLIGSPACRRYQKMRTVILAEAQKLGVEIYLIETSDTESLSKFNPLSLPRMYIGDVLIASQNPPKADVASQAMKKWMKGESL